MALEYPDKVRRRVLRWIVTRGGLALAPLLIGGLLFASANLPPLPVPPRAELELTEVTLVGAGAPQRPVVTIRIADGRITAINEVTSPSRNPPRYVLPGLIDAHVHSPLLPGDRALWATLYLLHGVTTVRNLGDGNSSLKQKAAVAAGREAGPRIFSCGIPLDGQGGGFPARVLADASAARAEVARLVAANADCVKVMPHLSRATFEALRDESRRHDLPIVGHVVNAYDDRGIEESGIVDVQHLTGVPTVPSPGFNDKEWLRFHRAFDTLPPERVAHIVSVSRRLHIVHTPTLVGTAHEVRGTLTPRTDLLPTWYATLWRHFEASRSDEDRALSARNLPRFLAITGQLHRGGVALQAGSDTFPLIPYIVPGAGLHDELRLLQKAGLTPIEALAAATETPGQLLQGRHAGLGRIAVGGPADLLVFRSDPAAALENLDSLETVIVDGRRYDSADLSRHLRVQLEASGRFPYAWAARLLAWLISLFA